MLTILAAALIPTAGFLVWADFLGKQRKTMREDRQRLSHEILDAHQSIVGNLKTGSVIALLAQALFYVGTTEMREKMPTAALAIFAAAIILQTVLHGLIERRWRLQKTPSPGSQERLSDAKMKLTGAGAGVLWVIVTGVVYFGFMISCVKISMLAADLAHLDPQGKALTVIFGAIVGILGGIALNFGLAGFHLSHILPTKNIEDETRRNEIENLFRLAGLRVPRLKVILSRTDSAPPAAAVFAGFRKGRGIFRPTLFISETLMTRLTRDELMAVVRHEISHLLLCHLRKRFVLATGLILAIATASCFLFLVLFTFVPESRTHTWVGPAVGFVAFVLAFRQIGKQGFHQEIEADLYSAEVLGSDWQDLAAALEKIDRFSRPSSLLAPGLTTGLHPSTQERVLLLEKYFQTKEVAPLASKKKAA